MQLSGPSIACEIHVHLHDENNTVLKVVYLFLNKAGIYPAAVQVVDVIDMTKEGLIKALRAYKG